MTRHCGNGPAVSGLGGLSSGPGCLVAAGHFVQVTITVPASAAARTYTSGDAYENVTAQAQTAPATGIEQVSRAGGVSWGG